MAQARYVRGGHRNPRHRAVAGQDQARVVSDQVWAFWDFLPTIAELTGRKLPAQIDGISILLCASGGEKPWNIPRCTGNSTSAAALIRRLGLETGRRSAMAWKGPIELYDLKNDREETHDVAAQHPDQVQTFATYFQSARVDSELWPIQDLTAKKGAGKAKAKAKGGAQ